MYFVTSGSLIYRRAVALPCPKYSKLGQREHFSEPALWVNWMHLGTMKSITDSHCMVIDSAKFRDVSSSHKDVLTFTCDHAVRFHEELRECYRGHGTAWDLPLEEVIQTTRITEAINVAE